MLHKIQQKLNKAYGKVGKKLGAEFNVYRPYTISNPLVIDNIMDTKLVSFSLDEKFKKAPSDSLNVWNCWIDGNLESLFVLQQGDLLKSDDTLEVWMIASMEIMLPITAIRLDEVVTISRSGYTDSGSGFAPGDTEVATSVPCKIEIGNPSGSALGYNPAASYVTDALQVAIIWLSDLQKQVEVRDAITDAYGQRYQVLAIENTPIGTKVIAKAFDAE